MDDLRPELHCYGAEYIQSPNIDKLASEGLLFERHCVQAPTCGASRYTLLTGNYGPYGNNGLFERASEILEDPAAVPPSFPAWFREHAVWGKHTLFEESLRSPLIIRYPGQGNPGQRIKAIVETIDLYPTLCELADIPKPVFIDGRSLLKRINDSDTKDNAALS